MPDITIDSLAALLRYCEEFAKQMLAEAGEFHPFAAFINQDGGVEAVGVHTGEEQPRGADVYQLLDDALSSKAMQRKAFACAIAANVNVPSTLSSPFSDGVRVHVEAPGYSRLVYTPYKVLSYRPFENSWQYFQLWNMLSPSPSTSQPNCSPMQQANRSLHRTATPPVEFQRSAS